jgi:hypothetical protein
MADHIQSEIPVSCETCLYLATHEKCDDCLTGKSGPWPAGKPYLYRNHQPATFGEAMEREHHLQVEGKRNIVISGQGEAEVNARWTVTQTYEQLVKVSEACGYVTKAPRFDGDQASIRILCHGEWFLIWKSGVFDRIEDRRGVCHWDRHPDFVKLKYSYATYTRCGFRK